jgi:hypothetical protein
VNIAAFLTRGLAWGLAGLTLLQHNVLGLFGTSVVAACWLACLAAVAAITASGTKQNHYRWLTAWALMLAVFFVLIRAVKN